VTTEQLEVGKQLRLVNGTQLGYSFELNNDQVFNEQIIAAPILCVLCVLCGPLR